MRGPGDEGTPVVHEGRGSHFYPGPPRPRCPVRFTRPFVVHPSWRRTGRVRAIREAGEGDAEESVSSREQLRNFPSSSGDSLTLDSPSPLPPSHPTRYPPWTVQWGPLASAPLPGTRQTLAVLRWPLALCSHPLLTNTLCFRSDDEEGALDELLVFSSSAPHSRSKFFTTEAHSSLPFTCRLSPLILNSPFSHPVPP